MMIIGHKHATSFKVNVLGTSAEPSARLILGTSPELCFPATKVEDRWVTNVEIPIGISPGEYPLRVEVIVNGRHFVPLIKQVEVSSQEAPVSVAAEMDLDDHTKGPEVSDVPEALPAEDTIPAEDVADAIEFSATVPKQEEAQPVPELPRISIIQMMADMESTPRETPVTLPKVTDLPKPRMSALETVVKSEPVKLKPRPVVEEPEVVKPTEKVRVKMSDIAKVAEAIAPVETSKSKKKKPVAVTEIKTGVPVRLVKGDIIYE